jgi:tRNA(Ile2) C34 agmatinyltransferase TiaS
MLADFKTLLGRYTVSEQTGMAVFRDFDPASLLAYGRRCKSERVLYEDALEAARQSGVQILMDGRGLIGAVAALPFFSRADESVVPGSV